MRGLQFLKILCYKSQSFPPLNYHYIKQSSIRYQLPLETCGRKEVEITFLIVSYLSWMSACFHFTTSPDNILQRLSPFELEIEKGILKLIKEFS